MNLSEPHNFGRKVLRTRDGRIAKPRSVFWEKLLLSETSFRRCLDQIAAGSRSKFALPKLEFEVQSEMYALVDELNLKPISTVDADFGYQIGCTIGLFAWLGLSDLHVDNIKVGLAENGQFVFCSVDVETILDDLRNLGHSGLIPDLVIPRDVCGLAGILSLFESGLFETESLAAICDGYIHTQFELSKRKSTIEWALCEALRESSTSLPLRVVLRKTRAYVNYMNNEINPLDFEIPVLPGELVQLKRGDVPYFFRYPESPDCILQFHTPSDVGPADLGCDVEKMKLLDRRKFSSKGWQQPRFHGRLLKVGVLQLARVLVKACTRNQIRASFNSTQVWTEENKIYLLSSGGICLSCDKSS